MLALQDDVALALRRHYYAATSYTDDNIGRVLGAFTVSWPRVIVTMSYSYFGISVCLLWCESAALLPICPRAAFVFGEAQAGNVHVLWCLF